MSFIAIKLDLLAFFAGFVVKWALHFEAIVLLVKGP